MYSEFQWCDRFYNKPCFTDRMISSQTQKIFGMDATIGHTLSRKPIGNRASYEYPWISLCLFLRSFVHMDTGLDNNNKDFLIVYLLLMWINAAMNCVNYWKFSCFMQLYCNIFSLREGVKNKIKKKNLEFSRFSGWVGLKKSIFQIKKKYALKMHKNA